MSMDGWEQERFERLDRRVSELEQKVAELDSRTGGLIVLGPQPDDEDHRESVTARLVEQLQKKVAEPPPPVDRTKVTLTDGNPVTEDHKEIQSDGMQKAYVVLSAEERAKGFVRPVRRSYRHIGLAEPKYPLRDLTEEEHKRYDQYGYVKFEAYPESASPITGNYWTQDRLNKINQGCGVVTTMGLALAETYARDPSFYGGTFCCGCGKHLPVEEFVWEGTLERVGT